MTYNILLFTGSLVWIFILVLLILLVVDVVWRTGAAVRNLIVWRLRHWRKGTKPQASAWRVFSALWLGYAELKPRDEIEE